MQEKFSVLFVIERVWKLIRKKVFNRGVLPGPVAMRIDIAPEIRLMPALGHRHVLIQSLSPGLQRQPRAAHKIGGAGDAFVGSFAFFLSKDETLHDAIKGASKIASISVLAAGTQTSFPEAKDLSPETLL